jgi:hypothetical protein
VDDNHRYQGIKMYNPFLNNMIAGIKLERPQIAIPIPHEPVAEIVKIFDGTSGWASVELIDEMFPNGTIEDYGFKCVAENTLNGTILMRLEKIED